MAKKGVPAPSPPALAENLRIRPRHVHRPTQGTPRACCHRVSAAQLGTSVKFQVFIRTSTVLIPGYPRCILDTSDIYSDYWIICNIHSCSWWMLMKVRYKADIPSTFWLLWKRNCVSNLVTVANESFLNKRLTIPKLAAQILWNPRSFWFRCSIAGRSGSITHLMRLI